MMKALIMKKPIINISLVDENYNFEFLKDNAVMQATYKSDLEKNLKTILYDNDFRKELIQNGSRSYMELSGCHITMEWIICIGIY